MKRESQSGFILLTLLAAACGGGGEASTPVPVRASASPGPALVVERFLRAANANDLETMTQLFGTAQRTISELEGRTRAERRMMVLASLLRHDDWAIQGQRSVPGRMNDATDLLVRLQQGQRSVVVPHLVVRRPDGGWVIERIDVESVTSAGGR